MEDAKRTLTYWFANHKTLKCVPGSGTTHDYHLIDRGVAAQVSFHPDGTLARWARCKGDVPHGKVTYWSSDGARKRVCDYVLGKRHGLDLYYRNGLMYYVATYRNGRKDGLTWDGDAMALFRHGKAVHPGWKQERLTYLATHGLSEELGRAVHAGAKDDGEALAAAAYENHTTTVALLLDTQTYDSVSVINAWKEALMHGAKETLAILRPRLTVDVLDHALNTGNLAEATELIGWGFYPKEAHLVMAATLGKLEVVKWCLMFSEDLTTHRAWNKALQAEHYDCARLLEPKYVRVLRALREYFF